MKKFTHKFTNDFIYYPGVQFYITGRENSADQIEIVIDSHPERGYQMDEDGNQIVWIKKHLLEQAETI
jgi:uncharacterized protein YqhQ